MIKLPKPRFRKLNSAGIAHYILPLALVMVMGVAGAYTIVSSRANDLTASVSTASSKKHKVKKTKHKNDSKNGASIQFIISEQVVDANGKTGTVARGNVPVTIESTDKKARCRDAGHYYQRQGDIIFAGKSDADRGHKKNLGKIKADFCKSGTYKVTINPASNVFHVVGEGSKTIILKKKAMKVNFTITRNTAPSTPVQAAAQDATPVPTPAPAVTPPSAITVTQEMAAIDKTSVFESNMFFAVFKSCEATDDLGDTPDKRKSKFAADSASYMTPELINIVKTKYNGDAFPLLGISNLLCGQYQTIDLQETAPIVSASDGATAVVEHTFTAKARTPTFGGLPPLTDVARKWTYHLVRDGDNWHISSVEVQ